MKRLIAVSLLVCAALYVWLADLEARAGGGHSFGRSSSRSSSSRSSSSRSSSSRSSSWGSSRSSGSSSWSWGSSRSSSSSWGSSRTYSSSSSSSSYRSHDFDGFSFSPPWWDAVRGLALLMVLVGCFFAVFARAFAASPLCPYEHEALAQAISSMGAAAALIGVPLAIAPLVAIFAAFLWWPYFVNAWEELENALKEQSRRARKESRAYAKQANRRAEPARSPNDQLRQGLDKLRALDPNFSRPLFMDFVGLLHARVMQARATGETEPVRAHAAPNLIASWEENAWHKTVDEVVLGAAAIERVKVPPEGHLTITVRLEASWLETGKDGTSRRIAAEERWVLKRNRTVLSKGPRATDRLGCPACGASGDLTKEGRCTYCDTVVKAGTFDWHLQHSDFLNKEAIDDDAAFSSGGEEAGTDEPTIVDPDLSKNERALAARHPDYSWDAFRLFAHDTFIAIQTGWTSGDLDSLRPLESNALWDTHRYWLERYRRAGLRNVLTDIRVDSVERVRYELDPYYESVTVRIFARMIDTTQNEKGQVVSGDPDTPRRFSEYWTFIAAIGTVPEGETKSCPACGAPMTLKMHGRCEHCDALIVAGQFGWVLSRIDQDEAYVG